MPSKDVTIAAQRKAPAHRYNVVSNTPAGSSVWVIITGKASEHTLEVDQIVSDEAEARREVSDLKKMGFDDARAKRFDSWHDAEDYQDKVRGY